MTLTVVRRARAARAADTASETVTRTADRVHVRVSPTQEWLFVRNPLDARRASAVMIDHRERVLVVYEDSELRNARGIRGWLDVLTLGLDLDTLRTSAATQDTRAADGVTFARYRVSSTSGPTTELWWNQTNLLPAEFATVHADGARTLWLSVGEIRHTIEASLLETPTTRFPTYREVAYADWLEGLADR